MTDSGSSSATIFTAGLEEYLYRLLPPSLLVLDHGSMTKLGVTVLCGAVLSACFWCWTCHGNQRARESSNANDGSSSSVRVTNDKVGLQSMETKDSTDDEDSDDKSQESTSSSSASSAVGRQPKTTAATATDTSIKCSAVREKARTEGLVLYNQHWYDVSKFIQHHPGGSDILEEYLGTDITQVFHIMHRNPTKIMQYRKPVRKATDEEIDELFQRRNDICQEMLDVYETSVMTKPDADKYMDRTKFDLKAFEEECSELYNHFVNEGYNQPTLFWLVHKTALVLIFLSLSVVTMRVSASCSTPTSCEQEEQEGLKTQLQQLSSIIATTPLSYILPGIFLGLFWHQSGFLMHDAEHHNLIGNERANDILGWLYGTVFIGVNGAWWREEHREHHAMLNTFDDDGFKDPQVSV